MKTFLTRALLVLAAGAQLPAQAGGCSKSSPAHTVALLELYTSEGCDSCPPADKFVSQLHAGGGLGPDQVLPLSLHVDYWDYIGWKDRYAQAIFSERQRKLAALAGMRSVYTPEVFIAGKELRNWRGGVTDAVLQINRQPARAEIKISLDQLQQRQLQLTLQAKAAQAGKLHFALVEQGLVSRILAGENRGATLQHDHVVRTWGEPITLAAAAGISQPRQIQLPADAKLSNLSLAAFVQSSQGEVLQALSLPLCPSWF